MKKTILTGDRPTGKLHLGHYVGSLRRRVELQNAGYDVVVMDNLANSSKKVIGRVEALTGKKVPYKIVGRRSGDIEKVWADTKKINNVMGWKAALTLDDMLLSAWKWEQTMQK